MNTREKFIQKKLDARNQVLSVSPRQRPKDMKSLMEKIHRETVDDYDEEEMVHEKSIFNFGEEEYISSDGSEYERLSGAQRQKSVPRSPQRKKSAQEKRTCANTESFAPSQSSKYESEVRTASRQPRSSSRESDRHNRISSRQSESDRCRTSSSRQSCSSLRETHTRTSSRQSCSSSRDPDQRSSSRQSKSNFSQCRDDELNDQHRSSSLQCRADTRGSVSSQNNRPVSSILSKIFDDGDDNLAESINFISLSQAESNNRAKSQQRVKPYSVGTVSSLEGKAGTSAGKWAEKMAYRNSTVDELLRYGDSYYNKESYDAAKTRYVAAIHKAKQMDLVEEGIADAHVKLAMILSRGDDIKQVLYHFNIALQMYEDLHMQKVQKKENAIDLGKKIIEVTTYIAYSKAEENDVDATLLAFKQSILRTQRCFPNDISANIKAMNAYAYALSFTANNHAHALEIMDDIIQQYNYEDSSHELMKSFIIKGKILLNRSRSTTLYSIQQSDAIEAQECFSKALKICKLHPVKFSAEETTDLVLLIRNAKDMQRVKSAKKSVVIADEGKCERINDQETRINRADSGSISSTDADSDDISIFHNLKRSCCPMLFDNDEDE